jgi:hypothetical protein
MPKSTRKPVQRLLRVDVGMFVEIDFIDANEQRESLSFHLVPDAQADYKNGFLGEGTPVARAILGHVAGDRVVYEADEIVAVEIRSIHPSQPDQLGSNRAAQRQESVRKAAEQSELTSTILFASSFNGKWGDYDPSGLMDDWERGNDPDSQKPSEPAKGHDPREDAEQKKA